MNNMSLEDALTIVMDLAAENTVDPREDEVEYKRQNLALETVEKHLEEMVSKASW